jgi:hypothetical protein
MLPKLPQPEIQPAQVFKDKGVSRWGSKVGRASGIANVDEMAGYCGCGSRGSSSNELNAAEAAAARDTASPSGHR